MSFEPRLLELFQTMIAAARAPRMDMSLPALPQGRLLVLGAGKAAALMARQCERHYAALGALARVEGFDILLTCGRR